MRKWIDLIENSLDEDAALFGNSDLDSELAESHIVMPDVTDTIVDLVKADGRPPKAINDGDCLFFAERVVAALGGQSRDVFAAYPNQELDLDRVNQTYDPTAPRHCFIVANQRVYDAEAPEGRDTWQELPFFTRRRW